MTSYLTPICMIYNINLEKFLGRVCSEDGLGEDGLGEFFWIAEDAHVFKCAYSEWFLSLLVRHRKDTIMELKQDMPDVAHIIEFIQGTNEKWDDLVVVENQIIDGDVIVNFRGSFPLIDLERE